MPENPQKANEDESLGTTSSFLHYPQELKCKVVQDKSKGTGMREDLSASVKLNPSAFDSCAWCWASLVLSPSHHAHPHERWPASGWSGVAVALPSSVATGLLTSSSERQRCFRGVHPSLWSSSLRVVYEQESGQ